MLIERVQMLDRGIVCCVSGCALAIATALRARKRPNLISNGFGFEIALILVLVGATYVFWWLVQTGVLSVDGPATAVYYAVFYGRGVLYAVTGAALLANGIYVARREGFSLAHALPAGWGAVMLFVAYWVTLGPAAGDMPAYPEIVAQTMVAVKTLANYVPFALFGAWISNEICYRSRKKPEREYVIVLGCGIREDGGVTPLLRGRLDAAIAAYEGGGRQAKIICSGGQGPDEVVSEAQAMANYLLEQGIPEADIILEDKSTTTEENLRFSRAIMEERGGAGHCTIATNSYHCLRAAMYARRVGLNASCVGGRTAAFFFPAAFFREYIALVVRNRYAVAVFLVLALGRFVLAVLEVAPETLF